MIKKLLAGFLLGAIAASGWLIESIPLQTALMTLFVFVVAPEIAAALGATYYFVIAVGLITSGAVWSVPAESGLWQGVLALGAFAAYVFAAWFVFGIASLAADTVRHERTLKAKLAWAVASLCLFFYVVSQAWGAPWFALMDLGIPGWLAVMLTVLIAVGLIILRSWSKFPERKAQQIATAFVALLVVLAIAWPAPALKVIRDETWITKKSAQDLFDASHLLAELAKGRNVGEQFATLFRDDARFDLLKQAVFNSGEQKLYAGVYVFGDGVKDVALEITREHVRVAREATKLMPFGQDGVKPGKGGDENVFICYENYFVRPSLQHANEVVTLHNHRWGDSRTITPALKASLAQARAAGAHRLVFAIVMPPSMADERK